MRILLNFSSIRKGGGIQVCLSLIEQLHRYPQITWGIIYNHDLESRLSAFNLKTVSLYKVSSHPLKLRERKSFLGIMNTSEALFQPDLVFSLFGPTYWRPKAIHLEGFAIAHFLMGDSKYFNIIALKQKIFHKISKLVKGYFFRTEADYWVIENQGLVPALAKFLNASVDKIFYVPNTCHQVFDQPFLWEEVNIRQKQENVIRLVCISAYYPHKNLEIISEILDIAAHGTSDLKLEFVTTLPEEVFNRLNKHQSPDWINLGPVKIEQCPYVYQQSDVLFLPSLLETFSASYVEAMKVGIPIVTTDLSFAHAICEDAALYFEPLSAQRALDTISQLSDPAKKASLITAGKKRLNEFGTSSQRLEKYISVFKELKS